MIDPGHGGLGIVRQCALVSISRSSFYYPGKGESPLNLALMRLIDAQAEAPHIFIPAFDAAGLGRLYGLKRSARDRIVRKVRLSRAIVHPAWVTPG